MRTRSLHSATAALAALALLGCSTADDGVTDVPSAIRIAGDVEFSADTHVMESFPVQLSTDVTARNEGATTADIVFPDGCVVMLRAYDNAMRAGAPVWDQSRDAACTMAIVEARIPDGDSETFRGGVSAADILGDSLPDGRYYLSAVLRPNRTSIEVAAGAADLAVPR